MINDREDFKEILDSILDDTSKIADSDFYDYLQSNNDGDIALFIKETESMNKENKEYQEYFANHQSDSEEFHEEIDTTQIVSTLSDAEYSNDRTSAVNKTGICIARKYNSYMIEVSIEEDYKWVA